MPSESGLDVAFTASNRESSFRYDLLDTDEQIIGSIDGVNGGSLTWSAGAAVKASGQLDVTDVDGIDWLHARIRVWRTVNGVEWSRGIYIPSAPEDQWTSGVRSWNVELMGKLVLLAKDEQAEYVSVSAGTNPVTKARALLTAAGHKKHVLEDSTSVLRSPLTWEPGTSLLTIVNDLLGAAGFWSLEVDGSGAFISGPYKRPAERGVRYELLDDEDSIYEDEFTREQDLYSIPNRVICIATGTGDEEALVASAENNDPESPYSIPSRGMVVTYREDNVEAATQTVLSAYARRRLIELSSVSTELSIKVAPIPIDLNDAVRFRRTPAGIDERYTVQEISEPLDSLDLMSIRLRKVVDL